MCIKYYETADKKEILNNNIQSLFYVAFRERRLERKNLYKKKENSIFNSFGILRHSQNTLFPAFKQTIYYR